MRFALVVVTLLITSAACGDSKPPPMVPDNPDLSQSLDGGLPATPASAAPTPNAG